MSARTAFLDGIRRVNRAPAILAGTWLLTLAVTLPPAIAVGAALEADFGQSLEAQSMADAANLDWIQEFGSRASGTAATFRPEVIGFGAVLENISALADRERPMFVVIASAAVYVILWTFLSGGVIDRLARDRATRAHGFFSAAGVFFFRFLRLGIVAFVAYGVLLAIVHPLLFGRLFSALTRNVTSDRTAFFIRVALYVVFGLLLAACNLLFDYAKVRAVVEDRRSAVGALAASVRFAVRRPGPAAALYAADTALFAIVLAAYAILAPGAGGSGLTMWLGFAVSQLYIAARLWVKLVFWGSETALFQGLLAHAGYVAGAPAAWPESPAAEAIGPSVHRPVPGRPAQ